MVWSSGGQLREVFFRLHIRLDIQSPQLDNLRKHLVDGEGAEFIQPLLRAIRDGRICVLCHNVGDVLEHLKGEHIEVRGILITVSDTIAPQQYRNVRRTLDRLLDLGAVPIINENDSLASNEIRFGDNDRLSALIANIVVADALVLLTDVDALYTAPPSEPGSKRISYVPNVEDALAKVQVGGTGSNVGTGGMVTKMEAARVAAVSGIPAVLTCASNAGPAMMGDPVGTAFAPINDRGSSRRLWIGFASHPQGTLVADSGAAKAVRGGAASLLAAGVVEVKGDFAAGDAVWVDDEQGNHLAKGLVGFDSEEIPQMLGRNTAQLKRFLGEEYAHPLVHRDNLVLV